MQSLNYDVLQTILEQLKFDRITLFSCVLLNRSLSTIAIPLLWESPYMIDQNINQYQLALLVRTYVSCFTEIEKHYLRNKCVKIRNSRKPIFDYTCYIKEILYSDPIHDSILYWILLEYRNYTKGQLNSIINVHQFNEVQLQPLINSLYYMFFNKGKLKSLGISVNTLKIKDHFDYQFYKGLIITSNSLTNLTIYLKDNNLKENYDSFKYLLEMISKWYFNIKFIRIFNLLVFNDQQKRLPEIQKIIFKQKYLRTLYLMTPEQNIIINKILSSIRYYNQYYLAEIILQGTDLSTNSRLEGLASINSLKSLGLCNCKGITLYNLSILSKSFIKLKKLKFFDNDFSIGLIVTTIGKALKKLNTNQLDIEATSLITYHCTESLLELEININSIIQELFFNLIKKLNIIYLKIKCCNSSSIHVFNHISKYKPNNLKYLELFINKEIYIEDIKRLLVNWGKLETLEIYGTVNDLMFIINYFKSNSNLYNKIEFSMILDEFNSGIKVTLKQNTEQITG